MAVVLGALMENNKISNNRLTSRTKDRVIEESNFKEPKAE
jgi:hypothetical protein